MSSTALITIPANLTDDDPIPFRCDIENYDPFVELAKYVLQVAYLLVILILNIMILRCIFLSKRDSYRANSFYLVYSTDLIVGAYKCVSELLIGRLFMYITPLCPILSPYFYTPSIFLKTYFTLLHYSDGFKTISQVFLCFNRMTCVVFPTKHDSLWKRIWKPVIYVMFLLPLGIIWNIVISRVYANPSSGGFSANYIKKVSWASVSKFHLGYFIGSLILIILFTGATIYSLVVLKTRIKAAERSITTASMVVSIEFLLLALIQMYFAFFSSPTSPYRPYILRALDYCYDSLSFFPPLVIIFFNRNLRTDLGLGRRADVIQLQSVMSNTTKKFVLPANFSYDDPLPFECDTSTSVITSLITYALQASYLILGAVLNILIIRTIFRTKQSVYRENSFYLLYTADAVVCIYINISELLIGRLFIYITPLCPIVSPYFFTPSIIFKTYYTAVHYSIGFKTVSQIFLSFNRMTCVIMPMQHISLWRKILYPVLITTFILPVGGIWNILVSRVYINPNGGGFSANVSILHLIYCVICFVLVIIFFFVTIFGLVMLERRVKGTERSLTLATMVMAIQMLIFAATQIYFVFFAASLPSIRPLLLLTAITIYDSMNVASPIALILMSRQLRKDIFNLSDDSSTVAPSKYHNTFFSDY